MNEVSSLLLKQNHIISKDRFCIPSAFPRSRRHCVRNCILCTSNEFKKI